MGLVGLNLKGKIFPSQKTLGGNMAIEDLVKLAEALSAVGYRITSLDYEDKTEPPFGHEVKITIVHPASAIKNS